jgi:hypothetical protein
MGMLIPQLVSRSIVACALAAGIGAIIFHGLPHQLGLIVAALCGVAVGMLVEHWAPSPGTSTPENVTLDPLAQDQGKP